MKKLDPRIKDRKFIFDCFNADEAKKYIGKKCYMSDSIARFEDVEITAPCILKEIEDGRFVDDCLRFTYCLPAEFVAPKEKKFRPYTLEEFEDKFPAGRPIKFRVKAAPRPELFLFQNDTSRNTQIANVCVYLRPFRYDFDWLFNECELYDDSTRVWKPFGVEE